MFPDEHMMCMMQIFLLWETVWVAFEFCSRIVKRHSSHFKSTSITGNWMNITDRLAAAFFNRWLAADVPPGWQLVSQVVLALHITPLRGGGGVIGRIGRERCSVKVHYSSHHMLNPACGASSLAREAALVFQSLSALPPFTDMIYYQAQPQLLRLSPSPFLPLRVSSSFLTQTDSINSLSDLSLTLTSRVTHTPKKKKEKKTGVEFFSRLHSRTMSPSKFSFF